VADAAHLSAIPLGFDKARLMQPDSTELLRQYYAARDNEDLPVTVSRLWLAYLRACEREMREKEERAA